jgi:hypothetical protein
MTEVEMIPARDDDSLDGPRAWCHVMYGLHALSAVVRHHDLGVDRYRLPFQLAFDHRCDHQLFDPRSGRAAPGWQRIGAGRCAPWGSPLLGCW